MGATAASRRALIIDEEAGRPALARLHLTRSRVRQVLSVHGALQAPLNGELELQVRALLDRGERVIVLDLTRTFSLDAAGIGQLVGAYNTAIAAGGALLVVHPARSVGQLLARVGLFGILCRG